MTSDNSPHDPETGLCASHDSRLAVSLMATSPPSATSEGVGSDYAMLTISEGAPEANFRGDPAVRRKLSKLLQGREQEWAAVAQKKGPLRLLDLPMDILKEIIKEVTHTNDLTALALTHSALHNLAIPHIYSRFDIVWPEATSTDESRSGVDALTYGLATLVMGHDVFSTAQSLLPERQTSPTSPHLGTDQSVSRGAHRQLGNHYSHFTRKFSLGNGPSAWVKEYMITKESGKMLGTLVALAVARMVNLETFIWDMPTGVLRDVWLTLSSLQYKVPLGECRLERVLVRWHDNSFPADDAPSPSGSVVAAHDHSGSTLTPIGISLPSDITTAGTTMVNENRHRVEQPTLSVLPPIKSLSVLDIDELSYLDEMSILAEKSKDTLRELRVGISKKALRRSFVMAWDGPGLVQVHHSATTVSSSVSIDEKRLGGVMGIILGRIFDIRKKPKLSIRGKRHSVAAATTVMSPTVAMQSVAVLADDFNPEGLVGALDSDVLNDPTATGTVLFGADADSEKSSSEPLINNVDDAELNVSSSITSPAVEISQLNLSQAQLTAQSPSGTIPIPVARTSVLTADNLSDHKPLAERKRLDGMLRLQTLELERVPLATYVLQKALDWSTITTLTILDCPYSESLWRMLRQHFAPRQRALGHYSTATARHAPAASKSTSANTEYRLNLKKLHTDVASPALIYFLKETLAPDTLEVLFLQDKRKHSAATVTIDAIYRGPLRRHKRSLKKVMIDSSDKVPKAPNFASDSNRWRSWLVTHDVLDFISSGSMPNLRELAVAIDYKDWHFFLRRLPQMSGLRSLNIPFIADHVTPSYDPKELAMQVVDMIFMRPEIELCYLGISNKCFEILENRQQDERHQPTDLGEDIDEDATEDEDAEDEDGDDDDDGADDTSTDEEDEEDETAMEAIEGDAVDVEPSEHGDSDDESQVGHEDESSKMELRLREILFYDDKVAIFKARHNRL